MAGLADSWVGKPLPRVTLESSSGGKISLPEGRWTLLYFYPKDDTPGCTKQACSYRDSLPDFERLGVKVFGVSADGLDSHNAFVQKFSLNFPLLSDPAHALSGPLGVWGEQEWQGKKYMGLSRDTFLVDPQGNVAEVWRKVSPTTTIQETYEAIKARV